MKPTGTNYSSIFIGQSDISMTLEGDLMLGEDGDLATCTSMDWLTREVNKRIRTNNPNWRYHPNVGASLEYYVGLQNNQATANRLRQSIEKSLSIDNIGFPGSWNIEVFPVGPDSVAVLINLNIVGVPVLLEQLIYNYTDGVIQPLEERNWKQSPLPVDTPAVDVSTKWEWVSKNKYQEVIGYQKQGG